VAGIALATNPSGVTITPLAPTGTFGEIHAKAKIGRWEAKVKTKGVSDVYFTQVTIQPGGTLGWHSHPGLSFVIVKSGTATFYDGDDRTCTPHVFSVGQTASFGLLAAKALEEGKIDGFWANGMGAEVAVKSGVGTLMLDARREGTAEMKGYTFPALVTSERLIREKPDAARAAIKAVQSAQKALKEDPNRATAIGRKLFPPAEAAMIAELIRRDLPFYESSISENNVASITWDCCQTGASQGVCGPAEGQDRDHRRRQRHRPRCWRTRAGRRVE
jgi:hypothetical protein